MLRIVLPLCGAIATSDAVTAPYLIATAGPDTIAVEVVVIVNVDGIVTSPSTVVTPPTAPHGTHCNSDAERNRHSGRIISGRRIIDRRICVHRRCSPHRDRVVARHINDLGVSLLNYYDAFGFHDLGFYFHLLVRL